MTESNSAHPLPPFAFKDEFGPGNGKNRPSLFCSVSADSVVQDQCQASRRSGFLA
jgi:hypothetical protein